VIGHGAVCLGPAARYLGRLAHATDRLDEALAHLASAIDSCVALRAPVQLAHTRLDYATALRSAGRAGEARGLVEQAAATAQELGLPLVARRAEAMVIGRRG
jgi:hypothetical protein